MDATSSLSAASTSGAARAFCAPRRERSERDDASEGHHHHHRARVDDRGDRRSQVFVSLKAQVQGTLQDLTAEAAPANADAPSTGTIDAELKARLRFSGPNGQVDLKLKIELDDVDGATFQSALQGFTETLYAALKSLYGTPAAAPAPAAVATDGAEATAVPASDTTGATAARLRQQYTDFDGSLGALTQRLAQPDAAAALPASIFGDLGERFARLADSAGAGGATLTLGGFLQALAERFAPPPPVDNVLPSEPAPAPAASTGGISFVLRLSATYRQPGAAPAPLALAA